FFSSRRRHTRCYRDWSSDVCSSDLKTRDVTELLVDAELPLGPIEAVATYHDACHLVHGQKIRREPRALLGRIPGLRFVDLPESEIGRASCRERVWVTGGGVCCERKR